MEVIQTRNIRHVFGEVDQQKGAMVCFVTPWGSKEKVALTDVLRQHGIAEHEDSVDIIVKIFESSYALFYRRKTEVECFTLREAHPASRPLGLSEWGQHVSQLHFFRFTGQRCWQMLEPGCVPAVPASRTAAAFCSVA